MPAKLDQTAQKLALTVTEAAAALGISRDSAYEAARTGQLPTVKFGRRLVVPRVALERLLSGAATGTATE